MTRDPKDLLFKKVISINIYQFRNLKKLNDYVLMLKNNKNKALLVTVNIF